MTTRKDRRAPRPTPRPKRKARAPRPGPPPKRARGGGEKARVEARLREAEETLRAIRGGDLDAIVVYGPHGQRVYTAHGAEHSFRRLVESMSEGAFTVHQDGTLAWCNARVVEWVGAPVTGLVGTPARELVAPADRPALEALFAAAGPRPARAELSLAGRDGEPLPVLLAVSVMEEDGEQLLCCVATDLSERRRSERLQALVEARDEFLSVASHELKTPLTSLTLYCEGVLHRHGGGAGQRLPAGLPERLTAVLRQARRITRLVNELLDVSRLRSGRLELALESVDLGALASEVVERFRNEAAMAGCELAFEVKRAVVGAWDRSRLDQIVTNLLSNAVKYGRGAPIHVSVERAGADAVLSVRDRGKGIDPADHLRIFERYERVAPATGVHGLGLGLWISRELAARMGGRIELESRVGQGSRFALVLPVADDELSGGDEGEVERSRGTC